ncbi:hypothetical protein RclHR1_07630003 [Rhizophagus clarus]|uniref:Uncharacterized protein n=1 Tax=Rhizophagus clarus TaxID=94130 RepID=A0A2Z6SLE6_9GLOM|nr:hypothetical protein RclHR1_07630003 [Rhizophagus clarus]
MNITAYSNTKLMKINEILLLGKYILQRTQYTLINPNIAKSTIPQMKLYGIFLKNIERYYTRASYTQSPILEITLLHCDFAYIGVGSTSSTTPSKPGGKYYVLIDDVRIYHRYTKEFSLWQKKTLINLKNKF